MKKSDKKNKKKSKFSTVLKVLLILAASFIICITAYGIYLAKKIDSAADSSYEATGRDMSDKRDEKVEPLKDNVSILFIGVDDSEARGQQNPRSDALILATLNNKDKTVKLLSIPRDSYVYIPYVGYQDKITHAHAFGGTLASIETVEQLLDVPVDYYVRMNFNAFTDIIDALGGIEVDVDIPYAFYEQDENDKKSIYLEPGLQELNGSEALALARTRKHDSDLMRGKRQQDILKAIAKKATSVTSITKFDDLIDAIGDNMKTDLTLSEMKSFIKYFTDGVPAIESLNLEGYDDNIDGVYYYQLDQESVDETKQILKNHLEITTSNDNSDGYNTNTNDSNNYNSNTSDSNNYNSNDYNSNSYNSNNYNSNDYNSTNSSSNGNSTDYYGSNNQ